jgi:uncharacterized protein YjeT (DUF2065 family)
MVTVLQIRIAGIVMLVLGMLLFLFGLVTWDKQVCATCFVVVIIGVTLLYYARRVGDGKQ